LYLNKPLANGLTGIILGDSTLGINAQEVHRWAYDYSKPGQEEDWVSQIVPLKEGEEELQH